VIQDFGDYSVTNQLKNTNSIIAAYLYCKLQNDRMKRTSNHKIRLQHY